MTTLADLGFRVDSSGIDRGTKALDRMDDAGGRAEKRARLLGNAAKAGGLAITASLTGALSLYKNFGSAVGEVSTLLDDSWDPGAIESMSDSVREMTKEFGGSATKNVNALYQVISAGASDTAEAIDTLTVANKLAIAGATDTETAITGLASSMNVYADSGLSATEAAESMFIAVKKGITTIPELSSNLGKVAPIAKTAGLSFDDLNASVSTITAGGISTAEAVTGLKAALSGMVGPGKAASELAHELGINMGEADIKSMGWASVLSEVREKTGGNIDTLKTLLGSMEAVNAVLTLTDNDMAQLNSTMGEMDEKTGVLSTAFNEMTDDAAKLSFQWGRFTANIKDAFLELGERAAPIVAKLLESINKIDFTAVISSVLDFGESVVSSIQNAWQGSLVWFNKFRTEPVAAFSELVIAVGNALSSLASTIGTHLSSALITAGQWALNISAAIIGWADQIVPGIGPKLEGIVSIFTDVFSSAYSIVSEWMLRIKDEPIQSTADMQVGIAEILGRMVGHYVNALTSVFGVVSEWMSKIKDQPSAALLDMLSSIGAHLSNMVGAFVEGFSQVAPGAAQAISNLPSSVGDIILGLIDSAKQWGADFVDGIKLGITTKVSDVVNAVIDLKDDVLLGLIEFIAEGERIASDFIDGFISGLTGGVSNAVKTIKEFGSSIISGIRDKLETNSPSKVMIEIGEDVAKGLEIGIGNGTSGAVLSAEKLSNDVVASFDQLKDSTQTLIDRLEPGEAKLRKFKEEMARLEKGAEALGLEEEELLELQKLLGEEFNKTGDDVGIFADSFDDAKSVITRSFGDIIFEAKSFGDALKGIFDGIARSIVDKLSSIAVDNLFDSIFKGSKGSFDFSSIIGGFKSVGSAIKDVATGSKTLGEVSSAAWGSIKSGISEVLPGLSESVSGILGLGSASSVAATNSALLSGGLAGTGGELGVIAAQSQAAAAGTTSFGASLAALGPVAAIAAAAYATIEAGGPIVKVIGEKILGVFSGARSSAEIMRDEWRLLNETLATGTGEIFKLAGGFEAAGSAGAHFLTGQNLESLKTFLDGVTGINTRLQEVDGTPVLRVLDDMGRGVVDLDNLIKGHTGSMTESFTAFGESASTSGDGIRDSFTDATGIMTQAVVDMAAVSDQKSSDIDRSFATASANISISARDASSVIDTEFTSAANTIRSESTSAAGILESQIKGGAQGAGSGVASFVSGANRGLDSLIRKAGEARREIQSIGSAGDGGGGGRSGFAGGSNINISNLRSSSIDSRPELKSIDRNIIAQTQANQRNNRRLELKLDDIDKRLGR